MPARVRIHELYPTACVLAAQLTSQYDEGGVSVYFLHDASNEDEQWVQFEMGIQLSKSAEHRGRVLLLIPQVNFELRFTELVESSRRYQADAEFAGIAEWILRERAALPGD